MSFEHPNGTPLFVATISGSNAAFLDGSTAPLATHSHPLSGVPLGLWYSRYCFILPIKAKSDIFGAFEQFKAYAENQSEQKIKILRDDKGGKYMSNAFLDFTTPCGIERQHTVRARPQQNGVAERANRVLSERLTTMLDESGLPKVFWGECLAALVHVWNRCPTEAVRSATLYELSHGRKPDVSHLRVWGCTAYVHIQKDKRPGLGLHMEKCVFIGYPQGYNGWKF
jgi:hypothetical protein